MKLNKKGKEVVYRFKAKILGGEWRYIVNSENKIPVSIQTYKGINDAIKKFRIRYPSISDQYIIGETLIAEPDADATIRLQKFKQQQKEEEENKIQSMWWNAD